MPDLALPPFQPVPHHLETPEQAAERIALAKRNHAAVAAALRDEVARGGLTLSQHLPSSPRTLLALGVLSGRRGTIGIGVCRVRAALVVMARLARNRFGSPVAVASLADALRRVR